MYKNSLDIFISTLILLASLNVTSQMAEQKLNTNSTASCITFIEERKLDIVIRQYQFSYSFHQYQCVNNLHVSGNNLLSNAQLIQKISFNHTGCYVVVLNELNLEDILVERTHTILPEFVQHIFHTDIETLSTPFVVSCVDNSLYMNSYLRVLQYFHLEEITIFVDENKCRKEFADTLRKRLDNSILHIISLSQTHFVDKLNYHLNGQDRIFILLTSKEVALLVLEHATQRSMDTANNIWITRQEHNRNYNLPHVNIIIGETKYKLYKPKQTFIKNYITNSSAKCTLKHNRTSISRQIDIWMWHGRVYKRLFRAIYQNGAMKYLLYETKIELGLKRTKLRSVKMVSVIGGPFLTEAYYLYNQFTNTCESSSLKCKKYNMTTQTWCYTCCYGYTAEFYLLIGKLLKFDVDLYSVEDGKYGGYNKETNTWNGMVGSVVRGEAIMATPLTINTERLPFIDFSSPFIRVEIGIATKITTKENFQYFNWRFLSNISVYGLLATFVFFLVSILLIFIHNNVALLYKNWKREVVASYSFIECFSYVAGIMFQRDIGGLNPTTIPARAIAISCAFGMVGLVTLYTASLTVNQVTKITSNDFLGLSDPKMRNPTSDFPFGTVSDTSTEDFFNGSPNEDFERMYKFMKSYNVETASHAIPKLLNGELGAFLDEYPFLMYVIAREATCKIEIHPNDVGAVTYGIALQKNSSWRIPVSEAVEYLKEEGILDALQKKWLNFVCPESDQREFSTFDLTFFATPTSLLLATCLLAAFILFLEIIYYKYVKRRR